MNQPPDTKCRVSKAGDADGIKSDLQPFLPIDAVFGFRQQLLANGVTG